jgi:glycosyltransferase involved in cell wall biosynthesis
MRTVLVYRSVLLPYSEVFIRNQLATCRAWRPVLVGRRLLHELPLDGFEVRVLGPRPAGMVRRVATKLRNLLGWPEGADILRGDNPGLLHAHFGPDAVEAGPLAQALGVPMVVTLHGFDVMTDRAWWESGRRGFSMRNYPRALLQLAQSRRVQFVAVSEAAREAAVAFGIPRAKVAVRYIGVDPGRFRPGPVPIDRRPRRVLFVGRLVEKKGCEYLLQAMAAAKARVADAQLLIVGDGPLREQLEEMAAMLGVPARFAGTRTQEELKTDLDGSRVLCLPSVRASNGDAEGFGLVLLEAQAAGVPVVSSAIGGAQEGLLDGVTGFRFAERDVETLAARLTDLLTDDGLALRMAAAAPQFVARRFDLHRCTRDLEDLYDSLVTPPGAMVARPEALPNSL